MGITDKEGFDLVMTHEATHQALQGLNTGLDSHQEELCCDYMAGDRAGFNGMDEGKLAASIVGFCDKQRRFCLYRNGITIEEFDKVADEIDGWYIGYRGKHPYIVNTHNGNMYDVFSNARNGQCKGN